jgi:inorganic pyrophosphatase
MENKQMAYENVSYGDDAPENVNIIIEIRKGEGKNKYEFDKKLNAFVLDRVNATTLGYPADYGYIPNTLCEDGDPLDALLVIDESVPQGVVVPARPIGVFYMIDDGEADEKLVCVAADDVTMAHIKDITDLGPQVQKQIEHFYTHYKDWKKDWQGVAFEHKGWGNADEAKKVVADSIKRAAA